MSLPLLRLNPHLLLLLSLAPTGVTICPHALQTGRWEENQRISKKTVDTFWKANIVTLLGIGCWTSLNIWLLLLWLNCNWSVWEICPSPGYWAVGKLFSFICFVCIYPALLLTLGRFHLSPIEGMVQCVSRRLAAVFLVQQVNLLWNPQVCWSLWIRLGAVMVRT